MTLILYVKIKYNNTLILITCIDKYTFISNIIIKIDTLHKFMRYYFATSDDFILHHI